MATIAIESVSKHFGDLAVFDGIDLELGENEFVSILGPSGCGKTTLLRIVAGIEQATDGVVTVDGVVSTKPRPDMTLVFQNIRLLPWRTVEDNVGYGLRLRGASKRSARKQSRPYISMVGLEGREQKYPYQLSGGMQQRVAIARAVAYEPHILLMDEPFAAVDAQTRADLEDLVRALWKRLGVTVLFVTHDIEESIYLGQRVLVLSGRPTVILEDVTIDLPDERDQITTRSDPEFARLRTHIYELVQKAKRGYRGDEALAGAGA